VCSLRYIRVYSSRERMSRTPTRKGPVTQRTASSGVGLSAWESVQSGPYIWPDLRSGLSVSARESPRFTRVNGPLMALRLDHAEGRPSAFQAGHIPSCYGSCERCRWSLPLAAGRCCCCHLGAGRPVASRPAPCRGWPASGPGRLRPGPCLLTGVSAEAPGSSVTSRVRSPGLFHLCSLPCDHSHA
jgi:hypothetical protein